MNPCNLNQLGVARESKWAVGHFNIHNQEFIRAVVRAAEQERSPAILAVGMMSIKYMGLAPLITSCQHIARETEVPVAIHLDHARDLDIVRQALELGINSVMFDGSALGFEENIEQTAEVVRMAHDCGATAEGEVGIVPHGTGQVAVEDMTNPERAVEFAERTGVDFLAVSLGSVHGMKSAANALNQELLVQLHERIQVPLVLHGASGVVDEHLKAAIDNGIRKINVNTGLKVVYKDALTAHFTNSAESDLLADLDVAMEAVTADVVRRMRLFGSSGKA